MTLTRISLLSLFMSFFFWVWSGKLLTPASWIRQFVMNHSDYKHDSVVTDTIAYDLVKAISQVSHSHSLLTLLSHRLSNHIHMLNIPQTANTQIHLWIWQTDTIYTNISLFLWRHADLQRRTKRTNTHWKFYHFGRTYQCERFVELSTTILLTILPPLSNHKKQSKQS